jgi:hypothetical protein
MTKINESREVRVKVAGGEKREVGRKPTRARDGR